MKRLLILLLLCCGAPRVGASEPPQCLFQFYTTFDGLTHDRIADIYTDSRGFVWVCTWYGVSRFDGYAFRNFNAVPGDFSPLSHHRFVSVSEDANGHLWFTTYNLHVYRFNRFTEQFEDVAALIEGFDAKHYRTTHCLHDREGGTWVAIAGQGVVRFAGRADASPVRVDALLDEPVLGGDVTAMFIDAGGAAWIAAADGQLNRVAADDRRRVRTVCELPAPAFDFAADSAGVYCATSRGVVRADLRSGKAERLAGGSNMLTAIAADSVRREIYVGSRSGELYRVAGGRLAPLAPRGPKPRRIRSLTADSHGVVWVTTTEAGITRYNPATDDYKHFEQEPYTVSYNLDTLTRIAEGGGRLWVKMNKYGFGYYDRKKDCIEPFYNDPRRPDCQMTNAVVRFDVQDDVLWLSTYYERGLRKAVLLEQPAEVFTLDSPGGTSFSGEIRALLSDSRGRVWVGTRDGELIAYGGNGRPLYRLPLRNPGMIYALREDRAGRIWVGTKGEGLYKLTPRGEGFAVTHYVHSETDPYSLNDDRVYSVEEDDRGRIWVATYGGGINVLDDPQGDRFIHAGNQLTHYPLDEAGRVRWLLFDRPDRMFAATVDGLLIFDPGAGYKQMRFRLVQKIPGDASSLGNNDIIHMLKDSQERIWLATYGGGLNCIERYDADGTPRFRCYDLSDGLPSNICMAIAEDRQGDLWVSTHNAVSRFRVGRGSFDAYNLYDRMRNAILSEATALTLPDGSVLFGGGRRIYRFEPDRIRSAPADCNLRFTSLDVRNKPVTAGPRSPLDVAAPEAREIVLPHDYANFRVGFAALNHAVQHAVRYMYKLEGYDSDWNLSGAVNRASYSNVPAGRYTLHVKAFVGHADTAGEGIRLGIEILPPPLVIVVGQDALRTAGARNRVRMPAGLRIGGAHAPRRERRTGHDRPETALLYRHIARTADAADADIGRHRGRTASRPTLAARRKQPDAGPPQRQTDADAYQPAARLPQDCQGKDGAEDFARRPGACGRGCARRFPRNGGRAANRAAFHRLAALGAGVGRHGAHRERHLQPAFQCAEIHPCGRQNRGHHRSARRRGLCDPHCARHGHRHPARQAEPHFRAFRAGVARRRQQHEGFGHRSFALPRNRGAASWRNIGGEHPGRGVGLYGETQDGQRPFRDGADRLFGVGGTRRQGCLHGQRLHVGRQPAPD